MKKGGVRSYRRSSTSKRSVIDDDSEPELPSMTKEAIASHKADSGSSDNEVESDHESKSSSKKLKENAKEEEGGEEEEEDEYVVEKVLKHRMARKGGGYEYLLKWEGYDDPSDNTWSSEADCSGCKQLIEAYWNEHGGRPEPSKRKRTARPKKSEAKEPSPKSRKTNEDKHDQDSNEKIEEVNEKTIKFADKSQEEFNENGPPSSQPNGHIESDNESKSPSQKESNESEDIQIAETPSNVTPKKKPSPEVPKLPDNRELTVKQVENYDSWEDLVSSIDTIERKDDGTLEIYLTWKNGAISHHPSTITNKKCPQKMLQFYESHLTFRENE
ncbi:Chromatin-associated protein swi6 [Schizosaccharomyces pombe]